MVRLVVLTVAGFVVMVLSVAAGGMLASRLQLPDVAIPIVAVVAGFGATFVALRPLDRWLSRGEAPKPLQTGWLWRTQLGKTLTGELPIAAPAGEHSPRSPGEQIRHVMANAITEGHPRQEIAVILGVLLALTARVSTVRQVVALVVALLVHELGRLMAMWLVDHRDDRFLYVPVFGTRTSGPPAAVVPSWKRAVVWLAGPLPGLALVTVAWMRGHPGGLWGEALAIALLLNTLDLLPLGSIEGGLVDEPLLAGRPWSLEVAFVIVSGVVLVLLGLRSETPFLCLWGVAGLESLPRRKATRALVAEVRSQWLCGPAVVTDPATLPEAALVLLSERLGPMLPSAQRGPIRYAVELRHLWALARQPHDNRPASAALLAFQAVCGVGALVMLATSLQP